MKYILLFTFIGITYLYLTNTDNLFEWWNPLQHIRKIRNRAIRNKVGRMINDKGHPHYHCTRIHSPVPIGTTGDLIIYGTVRTDKKPTEKDRKYPKTWSFSVTTDQYGNPKDLSCDLMTLSRIIGTENKE